jgi:hypothetical protein
MSQITACPHCSTRLRVSDQITDKTLICPRCLADVDNPQPGFQLRAADIATDVKRGLSVGSIVLAVLIGLCVFGIAVGFLIPTPQEAYGVLVNALPLMFFFAALDVFVSIAIVRGLVRWSISGSRTPTVGKVLGITFLSLGTIVAVVIFFFGTCMALLKVKSP